MFSLCSLKQQISILYFFVKIANLGSKEIFNKKKLHLKYQYGRDLAVLFCSALFPMNSTCTMCNLSITAQITPVFGEHWKENIFGVICTLQLVSYFRKMFVLCFILGEISINCSIWIIFIINIISILSCLTQFKMQNVITEPWKHYNILRIMKKWKVQQKEE